MIWPVRLYHNEQLSKQTGPRKVTRNLFHKVTSQSWESVIQRILHHVQLLPNFSIQ